MQAIIQFFQSCIKSTNSVPTPSAWPDPRFMATYNYSVAIPPDDWIDIEGWASFGWNSMGHFANDMLPYYLYGNTREEYNQSRE
jgi:hypothetical protein